MTICQNSLWAIIFQINRSIKYQAGYNKVETNKEQLLLVPQYDSNFAYSNSFPLHKDLSSSRGSTTRIKMNRNLIFN